MVAILFCMSAFLAACVQVALGNGIDLVFLLVASAAFFSSRGHALSAAWAGGLVLDLFSPSFGVAIISLPLCAISLSWLRKSVVTDTSLFSFEFLMGGGFLTLSLLRTLLRFVGMNGGVPVAIGTPAFLGFLVQGIVLMGIGALGYGFFVRMRRGHGYLVG